MKLKTNYAIAAILSVCVTFSFVVAAGAAVVPFTEDFTSDSANWRDATGGAPLGWSSAGGPDGGSFASGTFNFVASVEEDTPVLLRAQGEFGSSGGAFIGNWITEGVTEFSAFVKHDAAVPLIFFTRFSSLLNFPGATAIVFAPVAPNTWTEITFAIDTLKPTQFVSFEGTDFGTVFSNIGNVQIGISVPAALAGLDQTFTFDVDKATIVPEPATAGLLAIGLCAGAVRRRRRLR